MSIITTQIENIVTTDVFVPGKNLETKSGARSTTCDQRVRYDLPAGMSVVETDEGPLALDLHETISLAAVLRNQLAGFVRERECVVLRWRGHAFTSSRWRGMKTASVTRLVKGLDEAVEAMWPLHREPLDLG